MPRTHTYTDTRYACKLRLAVAAREKRQQAEELEY